MTAAFRHADHAGECLWTAPDGTACLLTTCEVPPSFVVSLVRDARVLRERRLYGRASAQMVADSWKPGASDE
jgi:hypothetical protein